MPQGMAAAATNERLFFAVFPSENGFITPAQHGWGWLRCHTSTLKVRDDDLDAETTNGFLRQHYQPKYTMKANPINFAILLAVAAGNLAIIAGAADTQSGLKAGDEKFVKQAGAAGKAEVKIATLGTQKAERSDVKELATQLVADHTKANAELEALAKSKGVELSAVIDPKSASTFESLEKEHGKDFDKAFLSHLEKAHKTCTSDFEDASKNAVDADVKAWAGKTLPTLKAHLDKVKELEAK